MLLVDVSSLGASSRLGVLAGRVGDSYRGGVTTTPLWNYGQEITFTAPARKVDTTWLHCSASESASWNDVEAIRQDHIKHRLWSDVGYHFFITKEGHIQPGRPLEKIPAAQEGLNTGAIAMCAHGLEEGKFTSHQFESIIRLCTAIKDAYGAPMRYRGHREVAAKLCPVFNYVHVLGLNTGGYMGGGTNTSPQRPTRHRRRAQAQPSRQSTA